MIGRNDASKYLVVAGENSKTGKENVRLRLIPNIAQESKNEQHVSIRVAFGKNPRTNVLDVGRKLLKYMF